MHDLASGPRFPLSPAVCPRRGWCRMTWPGVSAVAGDGGRATRRAHGEAGWAPTEISAGEVGHDDTAVDQVGPTEQGSGEVQVDIGPDGVDQRLLGADAEVAEQDGLRGPPTWRSCGAAQQWVEHLTPAPPAGQVDRDGPTPEVAMRSVTAVAVPVGEPPEIDLCLHRCARRWSW